jgi:diguanylate cyclase (GGDEF)-like protein
MAFAFASLRRAQRALSDLAHIDPLTRLPNRRFLALGLEQERRRALRSGNPITVLYLDLDDFKPVNDRFGHGTGDRVLKEVAAALRAVLRSSDLPARIGGDEFAVVLAECGADQARKVAAKLRAHWQGLPAQRKHGVGVSIGAVTFERAPPPSQAMLAQADALMYQAKQDGKGATRYRVAGD